MGTALNDKLHFFISDVSGQKVLRCDESLDPDETWGDRLQAVMRDLSLPGQDVAGRPMVYRPRSEREGRFYAETERVVESIQEPGETITILPDIEAGACS